MDSGSGCCDESYSTDTGVEGIACDMEISPGMTKYWRPICANSLKPHVGQQFDSLDSAFGFYKQYAGSVGFDCRQSTTRKGRDGGIKLKHVVCSREGFKDRHHSDAKKRRVSSRVGWAVGAEVGSIPALVVFPFPLLGFLGVVLMNLLVGLDLGLPVIFNYSGFDQELFSGKICTSSDLLRSFSCLSITIFSGYSIDVIPTMGLLFLPLNPSSCLADSNIFLNLSFSRIAEGPVSTRVDILSSAVAMVLVVLVISSTKSFWGSVPVALVGVGHQHVESMDLLLQVVHFPSPMDYQLITSRAKCLLNQGSPASVSNILVIIAAGVIHAVVFSKIALHSRSISGTALAARFVISICPIGSPRVAATSAAVIWIDCPFWSCKVQLLGSKFSTNHNPNLRGTLYEAHHRRHAPGQAAECVLLLDRVQSLFWVPLPWMSPPVQLLFFCCLHDIF
nr:protein FAR1-RELATED SEQUENCE 5-like [Ipomoea trifida]